METPENPHDDVPSFEAIKQKMPLYIKVGLILVFIVASVVVQKLAFSATSLDSPASGSTLSGTEQTFTVTTDVRNSQGFHVFVGRYSGSSEYYSSQNQGAPVQSPFTVPGLPDDGSPVNVRLYTITQRGGWTDQTDASFTSCVSPCGTGDSNDDQNSDTNSQGEIFVTVDNSEVIEAVAVMNESVDLLLDSLVVGMACLSMFAGWSIGMKR